MLPLLRPGSEVEIDRAVSRKSLRVGDVVAARRRGSRRVLLHRVVFAREKRLVTMGDNAPGREILDAEWRLLGRLRGVALTRENCLAPSRFTASIFAWMSRFLPFPVARRLRFLLTYCLPRGVPKEMRSAPQRQPIQPDTRPDQPRFEAQEIGKELAIYDNATGAVHVLNETAGFVWSMLRNGVAVEDIAAELRKEFAIEPEVQILDDVSRIISEFEATGLLSDDAQGS